LSIALLEQAGFGNGASGVEAARAIGCALAHCDASRSKQTYQNFATLIFYLQALAAALQAPWFTSCLYKITKKQKEIKKTTVCCAPRVLARVHRVQNQCSMLSAPMHLLSGFWRGRLGHRGSIQYVCARAPARHSRTLMTQHLHVHVQGFGGGASGIGAAYSVFALARIACNVPAGMLGDRYGRRLLLIGGALIIAVGEPYANSCPMQFRPITTDTR